MIYLSGAVSEQLHRDLPPMAGWMLQPAKGNRPIGGRPWGADNGCFGKGERFDADRWLRWLYDYRAYQETCLWAVVPDVVGDARATIERFEQYTPAVRSLGYRVAFVAQDGLERLAVPWESFDCLFIGGSTAWKLSESAFDLIGQAAQRGKWTHVGRVNSERRYRAFAAAGVGSVDGTYCAFGPDVNGPKVKRWSENAERQPSLFVGA